MYIEDMSILRLSREILQCDYLIERLREEADPDVAEIFRLQEKKDRLDVPSCKRRHHPQ